MNSKNTECEFTSKIQSCLSGVDTNLMFTHRNVKCLEINGEFVYLWQDAKGNVCYSFDLLSQEYQTTSIAKLGNALSSHFQCSIEAVNNIGESLKKMTIATIGLNKAISDSKMHDNYAAYSQAGYMEQNIAQIDLIQDLNQNSPSNQALIPQQYPQQDRFNQQQLHSNTINLSDLQFQYSQQTFYLRMNELPIVHKEAFRPNAKQAFFTEKGLNIRNKYIPSKYMVKNLLPYNPSSSFILSFIFAMAKNDIVQAMNILVWLVNSINTFVKLPYALVIHGENDTCMKLFYEEIVVPLFNSFHCDKIIGDRLDEKSLSKQLDEKIICNFHNIITPIILDRPAKEFISRLIHKDDYKLNNKIVTTVANILITSTSKYIPLIAKDVPCLVVSVESNLAKFCRDKNIGTNHYEVAKHIEYDLENFVSIVKNIDLPKLNISCHLKFYEDNNIDILDGDAELLEVFYASIKNMDKNLFAILKIIAPKLYKTLMDDFDKNRVNRINLIEYFTILFGEDVYKKNQNRRLIEDLRELSSTNEPFESDGFHNIHGIVYYYL
ncbi:MAG: hypothetical protein Q7T77_01535 [Sulfuricurvum sp.]|nr:hypothetical protein [Sulfuricurvum sp.]